MENIVERILKITRFNEERFEDGLNAFWNICGGFGLLLIVTMISAFFISRFPKPANPHNKDSSGNYSAHSMAYNYVWAEQNIEGHELVEDVIWEKNWNEGIIIDYEPFKQVSRTVTIIPGHKQIFTVIYGTYDQTIGALVLGRSDASHFIENYLFYGELPYKGILHSTQSHETVDGKRRMDEIKGPSGKVSFPSPRSALPYQLQNPGNCKD